MLAAPVAAMQASDKGPPQSQADPVPAGGSSGVSSDQNLLDKPIGDKFFGRETLAWFAASPLPRSCNSSSPRATI